MMSRRFFVIVLSVVTVELYLVLKYGHAWFSPLAMALSYRRFAPRALPLT